MTARAPGEYELEATTDVLSRLSQLMRLLSIRRGDAAAVEQGAQALASALAVARPPLTLQFVGAAILREGHFVPLDPESYRRVQQIEGALRQFGAHELHFESVLSADALTELAGALVDAAQGGRTRAPRLAGVEFARLRVLGDQGPPDELELEAFLSVQSGRLSADIERVLTRGRSGWPYRDAERALRRLERCLAVGTSETGRALEFSAAVVTRARRVALAMHLVAATLQSLDVEDSVRRVAAHAMFAIAAHGLDDRGGASFEEAAAAAIKSLLQPRARGTDPHRLRTCALVHAIAAGGSALRHAKLAPLLEIAFELEKQRAPVGVAWEVSRLDLWAWLSDQLEAGRFHSRWGRALIATMGVIPAGAYVLADGRLGVVMAPAEDALHPRVLVAGHPKAPRAPVAPHSPLGMTPWAK